jgi:hypothetical protein
VLGVNGVATIDDVEPGGDVETGGGTDAESLGGDVSGDVSGDVGSPGVAVVAGGVSSAADDGVELSMDRTVSSAPHAATSNNDAATTKPDR